MAGITYRASGRKQWQVRRDIGYETLFGLRGQLAKDGCPDSQLVIAKDLLKDEAGDREENARQGVYWLIRASEQGNEEATATLQGCLEKGQGITELNFPDVKACLSMTQEEKLARRAARKMFERLSAGEDFITSEQLLREIRGVKQAIEASSRRNRWSIHHVSFGSSSASAEKRSLKGILNECSESKRRNGSVHEPFEPLDHSSENEESNPSHPEDWAGRVNPPGEKLSEEHLVSAAVMYSQGEMPLVQRMLDLQIPVQAHFFNPFHAIVNFYSSVIRVLGGRGRFPTSSLFSSAVQILVAFMLYSVMESVDWYAVLPVAVYHGSFMAMIVFTCQMLQNRHEFHNFRVWSGLFLRYSEGTLNPDEAEYQYCRSNLKPYAHFFIALLINLMIYPLLAPHWTPHSELTVLSSCLMFLSLYAFLNSVPHHLRSHRPSNFEFVHKQPDFLVLFSFAVNVLAKYPYDLDTVVTQSWRFLDVKIPTFASYVIGHGIEFCLNFRAVFYLLMPAVFLKIARRDRWRGTYRTLIPHCVTLAWWQIAVLTAQGSTWYGLIRASLAIVGLVLFLPLAGLATVFLPLAAAARLMYMSADREMLQLAATILAATPLVLIAWLRGRNSPQGSTSARFAKLAGFLQIVLAVAAVGFLLFPVILNMSNISIEGGKDTVSRNHVIGGTIERDINNVALSWEQYESMCHRSAWERSTVAHVQQLCSPLEGLSVKWDGYISNIKVVRVRNPWVEIVKRLPDSIGATIACAVASQSDGRSDEDVCSQSFYSLPSDQQLCKRLRQISSHSGKCLLTEWDRYDFEFEIIMKNGLWGTSPVDIRLDADDHFRNISNHLRPGDLIWFRGSLANLGVDKLGLEPRIQLDKVGCIQCKLGPMTSGEKTNHGITVKSILSHLYVCIKFILNCLLNPIVILK